MSEPSPTIKGTTLDHVEQVAAVFALRHYCDHATSMLNELHRILPMYPHLQPQVNFWRGQSLAAHALLNKVRGL